MKYLLNVVFLFCIIVYPTFGQSPVSLQIISPKRVIAIPSDFNGLSLEIGSLRSGNGGTSGNMFDDSTTWPANLHLQVVSLFRELGLKNIRVGGGSVDVNTVAPTNNDIDAFFRFTKAINGDVIYSVRLLNGNITDDTNIVKYVWNNYKQYIKCFAIGNEPDWNSYHKQDPAITDYPSYLSDWRKFAAAITTAEPEVKFGGPDTGSNYPVPGAGSTFYNSTSWTNLFANDEKSSGIVNSIFLHNYVGQGAPSVGSGVSIQQMIGEMLSTTWDNFYYPALYNSTCAQLLQAGYAYRLTESNSFSGYRSGGSNSFATALFALDYLHWWAAHGAAGVNFHNKQWVGNGPIYLDANGNYQTYPVGYGIKAFDLGGHGVVDSVAITNSDNLNITAYAVQDTNNLYVTIINKEHGLGMRDAKISIIANGYPDSASVMYLNVPDSNVADTTGVLLGNSAITNTGWQGVWSPIDSINSSTYFVTVPASSAAIVKIKGTITSVLERPNLPNNFKLYQNYPNPFNPSTTIHFSIPERGFVTLKVYNILGQEVATLFSGFRNAGVYKVNFNASTANGGLSSGVYFYHLESNGFSGTKKMVLMK